VPLKRRGKKGEGGKRLFSNEEEKEGEGRHFAPFTADVRPSFRDKGEREKGQHRTREKREGGFYTTI